VVSRLFDQAGIDDVDLHPAPPGASLARREAVSRALPISPP
jgi:hypothetical protein